MRMPYTIKNTGFEDSRNTMRENFDTAFFYSLPR